VHISRDLNIVIPVDGVNGRVYVHSTPISSAVFDQYFLVLAKVYSTFDVERIWPTAPRISSLLLRQIAQATVRPDGRGSWWDGPDGIENGLLNEVRRLTNIVLPVKDGGWTTMPFHEAAKQMDDDDLADVESLLAFFTCLSASTLRHQDRAAWKQRMAEGLDVQLTSLNCSEYAHSLATSPETASSGGTAPTL
jgi:hypothetical protein